ncbi:MAG: hypothetical protein GW783_01465 [Deltaproteobacteria bacterium]|nr:hypothetical protein [Deltaproteobacteria bacterium]
MGGWAGPLLALLLPALAGSAPGAVSTAPVAVAATLHRPPGGALLAAVTVTNRSATPEVVEVEVVGTRITRRLDLPGLATRQFDLLAPVPGGPVVLRARAAGQEVTTEAEPLPPVAQATTVATVAGSPTPPPAERFTTLPDHWAVLLAYPAWAVDEATLVGATPTQAASITAARGLGTPIAPAVAGVAAPLLPLPAAATAAAFPAPLATALRRLAILFGVAASGVLLTAFLGRGPLPVAAAVIVATMVVAPRLAPPATTASRYLAAPPLQRATLTIAGFGHGPLLAAPTSAWAPEVAPPGLRWLVTEELLLLEQTGPLAAPVQAGAVGLPSAPPFREVSRGR